jgi:6-methylpretetramide 4-monooxygenase / 4-hydroxy-6-methylpretetramide 12a-monooxygenase
MSSGPVPRTRSPRTDHADRPRPDTEASTDVDVLVVGAGPTGLTAAVEAVRHGMSVRIVDQKPRREMFSKALVVHARTMEVFETLGLADSVLAEGARFAALNIHAGRRRRRSRVDLLDLPWGDTAYPFWLSIPQYTTESILERHLEALGGQVEWGTALDTLHDHSDHVEAEVTRADGPVDVVRARWLIGCDGGRSRVREQVGLRLDRTDAGATFVLADVRTTAELVENEGHVFLGAEGLLLIVPMPEPTRWRIIAHAPGVPADSAAPIDAAYLDDLIRRRAGIEFGSHDVAWGSRFNLTHGVADRYRSGRVFLAGDAAHVHSPVGGQGLNTGVQDAHNLIWKLCLASDLPGESATALLDSYEAERRPVADTMVSGVARVTGVLTQRNGTLRRVLAQVAPRVISRRRVRARLGRHVGMLEVGYGHGPLVKGGAPVVGRRMPNPRLRDGCRLHERLDPHRPTWIVRSYPDAPAGDPDDPRWGRLPVCHLPDEELNRADAPDPADLPRVTLVRPDGYILSAGDTRETVRADLPNLTGLVD